jgi:hypothetical protein
MQSWSTTRLGRYPSTLGRFARTGPQPVGSKNLFYPRHDPLSSHFVGFIPISTSPPSLETFRRLIKGHLRAQGQDEGRPTGSSGGHWCRSLGSPEPASKMPVIPLAKKFLEFDFLEFVCYCEYGERETLVQGRD